jgi:hypothetical protein
MVVVVIRFVVVKSVVFEPLAVVLFVKFIVVVKFPDGVAAVVEF